MKSPMFAVIALALLPGAETGPSSPVAEAQTYPGSTEAAVRNAREMFNRAIERRDADAIGRLLAPRYHVVTGRGDVLQGGDEEARRWVGRFRGDRRLSYWRTPTQVTLNQNWAIAHEVGEWTGRNTADGVAILSSGVYSARWQRAANGRWVLLAEIFTTLACEGPPAGCVAPDPIFM